MPLTDTLETARRIESLGFTHQQAQGFAELFEETAHATQQSLKDFIRQELSALEGRLEGRFERSLRVQLATILTAFVGVTTLAVAIIKLFPNAH